MNLSRTIGSVLVVVCATALARAEIGVTPNRLLLGASLPRTGTYGEYGDELIAGSKACFEAVNAAGGVAGRRAELQILDDAYVPAKTFENTRALIEKEKVFALFSYFGTPTIASILPYVRSSKVPMLFPFSGGEFLRRPTIANIFLLRSAYGDETYELTRYAIDVLNLHDIGIFYQDDALGTSARTGIERAMNEQGHRPLVTGAYLRSTEDVTTALEEIVRVRPKAVFLLSMKKPAIDFIKRAGRRGYHPTYFAPSPSATYDMAAAVAEADPAATLYLSSAVPFPEDTSLAIVRDFQRDMKAIGNAKFSSMALETYIDARVLVEALKIAGKELTREKLIAAIESLREFDLGGFKTTFTKNLHQGSRQIFLREIKNGQTRAIQKPN